MERSKLIKLLILLLSFIPLTLFAETKGIYLSQLTAQNSERVEYLIKNAKETGIDTFIVDYVQPNKSYAQNIQRIKDSGLHYVARIVIFPGGGTRAQVTSASYLAERLARIHEAVALGADEIQLDYIRYKPSQKPSPQNAEDITGVIRFFRNHIDDSIPLQVDTFGVSSFKPALYIGQNIQLIAPEVDAINPMVYPSHYEPYKFHARQPYETVFSSLEALKQQIPEDADVKVHAYIELFNYRYPMSIAQRENYIRAQMKAVADAEADGWYAWSANNRYDILFDVLRKKQQQQVATNDTN